MESTALGFIYWKNDSAKKSAIHCLVSVCVIAGMKKNGIRVYVYAPGDTELNRRWVNSDLCSVSTIIYEKTSVIFFFISYQHN